MLRENPEKDALPLIKSPVPQSSQHHQMRVGKRNKNQIPENTKTQKTVMEWHPSIIVLCLSLSLSLSKALSD